MTDNKMLSQEEIDALLSGSNLGEEESPAGQAPDFAVDDQPGAGLAGEIFLDDSQRDALGEIGNISMGSASTTLSELLHQKVVITSPTIKVMTQRELFNSFSAPYIVIQVEFKAGLDGFNVLVIKLKDAMVMANLMMGGDGQVESEEITEIELSAASEAMNQMIGTASTSLSTMFGRSINISPPLTTVLETAELGDFNLSIPDETIIIVSFNMKIGDLVDTEIMQVLSIDTARNETALLWENLMGSSPGDDQEAGAGDDWLSRDLWPGEGAGAPEEPINQEPAIQEPVQENWISPGEVKGTPVQPVSERPPQRQTQAQGFSFPTLTPVEQKKLELLLDVPLKVSVILGRTKRPIKEVLNLTPGAIVELSSLVDEPVEVLVNGTLVAKGEVVVVNENFGVRITNIISPEERIRKLRE